MKRIRKLIATFTCAIALVLLTVMPAKADFFGTLRRDQPWQLQIANGSSNAPVAATVVSIVGRKFDVEALPLVPAAGTSNVEMPGMSKNTIRIIIEVDPPLNGTLPTTAIVVVTQGANTYSADFTGHGRMVLDVI
jgi:hypothetical protein